jgi:anti-anti-sigma factor
VSHEPRGLRQKTAVWPLAVTTDRLAGVFVLAAVGRLGAATAGQLEAALAEVREEGGEKVVLDLEGVDYVSSAAILAISSFLDERTIVVCGLGDAVRLTFDLAGVLPRLTVVPSRTAALAALVPFAPIADPS